MICNFSSKRNEYLPQKWAQDNKKGQDWHGQLLNKKEKEKIANLSTPEQESTTCTSFLYKNREQHKL